MSRKAICALTVLLLLTLCAGFGWAQQPMTTADTIAALEQARAQALLRADTVALGRLVADDFIEISRLGTVRTRADNINDVASGVLKLTAIRYDSTRVRVYGNTAVLTEISDNTGTFRGMPFSNRIRVLRVFVRTNGKWQAVAMQQTPIQ